MRTDEFLQTQLRERQFLKMIVEPYNIKIIGSCSIIIPCNAIGLMLKFVIIGGPKVYKLPPMRNYN